MLRVLIDGNNMAHRLRHIHADLATAKGVSTGVVYGMVALMNVILRDWTPDEVIVCWDSHSTWRTKVYPKYKAQRGEERKKYSAQDRHSYKDFYDSQMPDAKLLLACLGIPQVLVEDFEADDIIAAFCYDPLKNIDTLIVSTDKDFLQLVSFVCGVRVYNPVTQKLYYQEEKSKELKCGGDVIAPSPFVYYCRKVIIGDVSDNLPGLSGVGEKTASIALFNLENQVGTRDPLDYIIFSCNSSNKASQKIYKKLHDISALEEIKLMIRLTELTRAPHNDLHNDMVDQYARCATKEGFGLFLRERGSGSADFGAMGIFFRRREFTMGRGVRSVLLRDFRSLYIRHCAVHKACKKVL